MSGRSIGRSPEFGSAIVDRDSVFVPGVLRVCGSEAQVADVQRQLECLGGPRKQIPTAASLLGVVGMEPGRGG